MALSYTSDMTSTKKMAGPIEVWLSQPNMQIQCHVVYEDESTESYDVTTLSMRGAQREMTGYFINQGYKPAGRWEYTDAEERECFRQFTQVYIDEDE